MVVKGRPVPDLYAGRFSEFTPEVLLRRGVRGLFADVDETLVGHGDLTPTDEVLSWLDALKAAGITVVLVSNNSKRRAAPFAAACGVPFLYRAHKPSARALDLALCALCLQPTESALLGDQLYTDVGAARRAGMQALLVDPIKGKRRHVFVDLRRRLWEKDIRKSFKKGVDTL